MSNTDLADAVHILNVRGYIGSSTKRELAYAVFTNKVITFLEPEKGEAFMQEHAHELGKLVSDFMLAKLDGKG